MRYWGFFALKLFVVALAMYGLWEAIHIFFPSASLYMYGIRKSRFAHDLPYTLVLLLYNLVCQGLLYLIIWDQRYRCRTCLRRLRMPVEAGSWGHMLLFGPPRTGYICTYGHGTLDVPEIQGLGETQWKPHGDMWTELVDLEDREK